MDLAIVGVGVWIKMDGKKVVDCRIGMASVGPTTARAFHAEKVLIGNEISDALIEEAAKAAAKESKPRDGVRASEDYKRDMIRVYTKRAVKKAIETKKA